MGLTGSSLDLKVTWLASRALGKVSARLGGAMADRLWFTPWPAALSERALEKQEGWLATTEHRRYRVGRHEIAAYVQGSGPTVLVVHGWGDSAGSLGAFISPLARSGYRVVAIDLPAHGRSGGKRSNAYEMTEVIHGIAEQVGGVDAVVAHSIGAHATMLALREALRPRAVVLLAPSTDLENTFDKFNELFSLPPLAKRGLRASIERRFTTSVWGDFIAEDLVANVEVPALVIHDRGDTQIDVSGSERLVKSWPSARLHVTEGLSHTKIVRDPDVIAAAIDFIGEARSIG